MKQQLLAHCDEHDAVVICAVFAQVHNIINVPIRPLWHRDSDVSVNGNDSVRLFLSIILSDSTMTRMCAIAVVAGQRVGSGADRTSGISTGRITAPDSIASRLQPKSYSHLRGL